LPGQWQQHDIGAKQPQLALKVFGDETAVSESNDRDAFSARQSFGDRTQSVWAQALEGALKVDRFPFQVAADNLTAIMLCGLGIRIALIER
jgi:hypothetical protein